MNKASEINNCIIFISHKELDDLTPPFQRSSLLIHISHKDRKKST